MNENAKKWRKVKRRKSHSRPSPPVILFPIGIVVISLLLFCLFIYYFSTHRIKLDWLY
jgi:hypothetical protein